MSASNICELIPCGLKNHLVFVHVAGEGTAAFTRFQGFQAGVGCFAPHHTTASEETTSKENPVQRTVLECNGYNFAGDAKRRFKVAAWPRVSI